MFQANPQILLTHVFLLLVTESSWTHSKDPSLITAAFAGCQKPLYLTFHPPLISCGTSSLVEGTARG